MNEAEVELGPRERILKAALELFVERGYFNTNVPDISKRSRCSVGSIYHHFLNKEEIARHLFDDAINQFRSALARAIAPHATLEPTIRALVKEFLIFSENHTLMARYLWLARHNEFLTSAVPKPTVVGFDALGRRLTKVIKGAIRSGDITPMRGEIIWSIVFGIPLSYLLDWLDGYAQSAPGEVADLLADSCWSALQGARHSNS